MGEPIVHVDDAEGAVVLTLHPDVADAIAEDLSKMRGVSAMLPAVGFADWGTLALMLMTAASDARARRERMPWLAD